MAFTVIVPSRNPTNLAACVKALRNNEPKARIKVVWDLSRGNNHLQYEVAESLGLYAYDGDIIEVEDPFIFAKSINTGIRNSCNWDDIVILGDDGLLQTPGGFSLLESEAEAHPEYGIISATMNNVGNRNQWPQGIGLREEPRVACFVAVYIPRSTIDAVGLMDERFTAYGFDDDDYCLRVRRAGLKIGIHDGCYVDHGSLTSTYRGNPDAPANLHDGLKIFVDKWGSHPL